MPPPSSETLVPWCCPLCRGPLGETGEAFSCASCARDFPIFAGIPDFRVPGATWVDVEADRARAREIEARSWQLTPQELVACVFRLRGWPEAEVMYRASQIITGTNRLRRELDGWLRPVMARGGPLLDLGCGAGQLLAASSGRPAIGIDVVLEWLVVARHLTAAHGARPMLAAAMAEALPLQNDAVGSVVSLDVIEHVGDQRGYLKEIERVLAPGGVCALATPNRRSLAPEPHVGVWGVGWLPRRYQAGYVRWRSGKPYAFCRLLSPAELSRMLARSTTLRGQILIPEIPAEEIAAFSPSKARVARFYNRLTATWLGQQLLTRVGAFFRVLAEKPA